MKNDYLIVSETEMDRMDRELMALMSFYGWVKGTLESAARSPEKKLESIREGMLTLEEDLESGRKEGHG